MKDIIEERIAQLASAQECMVDVAVLIERWEHSQLILEKSAFTSMNTSDRILNLSMNGSTLVDKLHEEFDKVKDNGSVKQREQMEALLQEIRLLFDHILCQAKEENEIAHQLELEVALQREIGDEMTKKIGTISESVEAAVACAEFMLAEL